MLCTLRAVPDFCNGRALRDYQKVSLEWNIRNWSERTNCILGDEVGAAACQLCWLRVVVLAVVRLASEARGADSAAAAG